MENLINSVKDSIGTKNWYGALTLALTLPDIAGKVEYPTIQSSQKRYSDWFDNYIKPKYTVRMGANREEMVFLSGGDCYALRCSYLHEGSQIISHQSAQQVLDSFRFSAPISGRSVHCNRGNNTLQLQIDKFCLDIIDGINQWLNDIAGDEAKKQVLANMLKVYEFGNDNPVVV
jgi:hypothetical protein